MFLEERNSKGKHLLQAVFHRKQDKGVVEEINLLFHLSSKSGSTKRNPLKPQKSKNVQLE